MVVMSRIERSLWLLGFSCVTFLFNLHEIGGGVRGATDSFAVKPQPAYAAYFSSDVPWLTMVEVDLEMGWCNHLYLH